MGARIMPARQMIWLRLLVSVSACLLPGCASMPQQSQRGSHVEVASTLPTPSISTRYRETAERITRAILAENQAYDRLEELCVGIGHRLSGSIGLEKAIDWAMATMKSDGQVNVGRENVMVRHWVRGDESVTMLEPRVQKLNVLGLGDSVGTPPEGITAPVVVVADEEELEALGEGVRGKIVLFNRAMPPYDPRRGSGYGTAVRYRVHGARMAAERGAVGSLIRSVTASSLHTPHTGGMQYGDAPTRVPAAALTIEDTETIARLQSLGIPVVVNMKMEAKSLPDAVSANVIGELRGSTHPEEVVVIGGHIDSWDVGHGAHDDAGGCVIAMEAMHVLRKLNLIPRRTIRVVLWTNEENGLAGGKAYAAQHAGELGRHVAAIESDSGVFKPLGYGISCTEKDREAVAAAQLEEIMGLFPPEMGELTARIGGGGPDISPMRKAGVILMGHRVEGSRYFDYHHTHADTIDKVDREELSRNVAMMATVAYILADMPERFGGSPSP